jgi:prophage regulatory protein
MSIHSNPRREVVTAELAERSKVDPFLRRPQVQALTGLTTSAIYRAMDDPHEGFPKPYQLTKGIVAWRQSEVIGWLDSRPRASLGRGAAE